MGKLVFSMILRPTKLHTVCSAVLSNLSRLVFLAKTLNFFRAFKRAYKRRQSGGRRLSQMWYNNFQRSRKAKGRCANSDLSRWLLFSKPPILHVLTARSRSHVRLSAGTDILSSDFFCSRAQTRDSEWQKSLIFLM